MHQDEAELINCYNPAGVMLFSRNIDNPEQVYNLIRQIKNAGHNWSPRIWIDQEGGKVQRLTKPHWSVFASHESFEAKYLEDAAVALAECENHSYKIAGELKQLGIDINCAPVLDVRFNNANEVIGSRSFSKHPEIVADLGRAFIKGHVKGGIKPVVKHIPGHGRAKCDSHFALPEVDVTIDNLKKIDLLPFDNLVNQYSIAMLAHVIFKQIDNKYPASCSNKLITDIIKNYLNFRGVLVSDDIYMGALTSFIPDLKRRVIAILSAKCDLVLSCNGNIDDTKTVLEICSHSPLASNVIDIIS